MQRDFHYDIIFALAMEAGYSSSDANIIAYASQYVDDNTDREYMAVDSHGEFAVTFPERLGTSGNLYFPIISQAADITAFKIHIQRYVFAPFHFIPGDNNVEIKGMMNPLCTTRGCSTATTLLSAAVRSKDLYAIGIALHAYADTWAHERFSAFHEVWNRVHKVSSIKSLPPNIGHAEVFHKPDVISETWIDERFGKEKINNRERALLAAENIFGFLKNGKGRWSDVRSKFSDIMAADNFAARTKMIKEAYPDIEAYQEDSWINEAMQFKRAASEVPDPDDMSGTSRPRFVSISIKDSNAHWFRFQNAAKNHLAGVLSCVRVL